jgi:hypothetical protein
MADATNRERRARRADEQAVRWLLLDMAILLWVVGMQLHVPYQFERRRRGARA